MIIERNVAQLLVGSWVVKIVKQKGNYKLKHPGWIKDFQTIENLIQQGVLRVTVDTRKHIDISAEKTTNSSFEQSQGQNKQQIKPQQEVIDETFDNVTSLTSNEEIMTAKQLLESLENNNKIKNQSNYKDTDFIDAYFEAKKLHGLATNNLQGVFDLIENNQPIQLQAIQTIIEPILLNIEQSPQAMLFVINVRDKSRYLIEHSIAVTILIAVFGYFHNTERERLKEQMFAALLHDVGDILIDKAIIDKSSKLTLSEYQHIQQHVKLSLKLLKGNIAKISYRMIAEHHEKLDGSGYPEGLNGEHISDDTRLLSICDIYDSLSSPRPYQMPCAPTRAMLELRSLAKEGKLDALLVDRFIQTLGVYPLGSLVRLSSGKLAMVEKLNLNEPLKPLVRCFFSLSSNCFIKAYDLDLLTSPEIQIEAGIRAEKYQLNNNKISEFLMLQS